MAVEVVFHFDQILAALNRSLSEPAFRRSFAVESWLARANVASLISLFLINSGQAWIRYVWI
jgi:hypothetical protein